MVLVLFLNVFMCVTNWFSGNLEAMLGWMVACMWTMRVHHLEIRLKEGEGGRGKE